MDFIKKVDSKNISIFRIHFYPKFGAQQLKVAAFYF